MTEAVFKIAFLSGPKQGKSFRLVGSQVKIGRGTDNDIVLDDKSLSRHHVLLVIEAETLTIKDLHSTNGVFIDDRKIADATCTGGELVRIGDIQFQILLAGQASRIGESRRSEIPQPPPPAAEPAQQQIGLGMGGIGLGMAANPGMPGMEAPAKRKFALPQINTKRLVLYGGAGGFLLLMVVIKLSGGDSPQQQAGETSSMAADQSAAFDPADFVPNEIPSVSKQEANTTYTQALLAYDTGRFNQALSLIEALIRLDPDNSLYKLKKSEWFKAREKKAQEFFDQGRLSLEGKYYYRAYEAFRMVLQLIPEDRHQLHLRAAQAVAQLDPIIGKKTDDVSSEGR